MTRASHSLLEPPRWTQALLRFALPSDSMRDAILGDLHEEFTHDLAEAGARRARLRHVSRATSAPPILRARVRRPPPASAA